MNESLACTYITIPQVLQTHAVLLSQIDWMWGAEMGANDCGVVIGNEAIWTKVPDENGNRLLGMDLVRLGLERGGSALESLHAVTALLEAHGQGGACGENDPSFTYHNYFLIADFREAWVLETAGRLWVAQRITHGGRNISNGLTIRSDYDMSSKNLRTHARKLGLWNGNDDDPLDFANCFGIGGIDNEDSDSRQACGRRMLEQHANQHTLDVQAMKQILRDHDSGVCMHGGAFETTASMISELKVLTEENISTASTRKAQHWMTGKRYPCQNEFVLQEIQ